MGKVLIVTNDFPPRSGGIQSFVHALAVRMPAGSVAVYAPAWAGAAEFDAAQPFPVVRHPGSLMLPVPSVARRAVAALREHGCDTVLFGAAAPLGLLSPALRRAGARRIVGLTHGHEAGWAALPGARQLLRRIGDQTDALTFLGEYFRTRIGGALSPAAAARMVQLAPGVDTGAFRPGAGGAAIRERLGLGNRPVVICVSRMVPRKGQDTLIKAWPQVLADRRVPAVLAGRTVAGQAETAGTGAGEAGAGRAIAGQAGNGGVGASQEGSGRAVGGQAGIAGAGGDRAGSAWPEAGRMRCGDDAAAGMGGRGMRSGPPVLLLVGDGPYRGDLARLAERTGVADSVVFTGPVPWADLPAYYDAGDVFAMPCRTRRGGLDVEGLGIVYLEASATGLPVVGGDSGGAPDAIVAGQTGYVVPGNDPGAVADRLAGLLAAPEQAVAMGERGAAWVHQQWRWDLVAERLMSILAGDQPAADQPLR